MVGSRPFTVRLSDDVEDWLNRESRRAKLSKGALLVTLADEAIRSRRFPGIGFRGPENDRRSWVIGTGLDVWEIVEAVADEAEENLLESGDLSVRQVDLALAYHAEYPAEIDELIAENQLDLADWRARYPGLIIDDRTV